MGAGLGWLVARGRQFSFIRRGIFCLFCGGKTPLKRKSFLLEKRKRLLALFCLFAPGLVSFFFFDTMCFVEHKIKSSRKVLVRDLLYMCFSSNR